MAVHFRLCKSDEDFARFTLFFIRNRHDFSSLFSLGDVLVHILGSISDSQIILIEDDMHNIVGWGHYQYVTAEREPDPFGEIVFIHSVILSPEYRSSRVFLQGFRHLMRHVLEENHCVRQVQFTALTDHAYLNRLYSKFARMVGEQEGYHGQVNLYSTDFDQLLSYLSLEKNSN